MADKFLGLQYPLVKTPRGIFAQKSGVDQIKADLLQLLLTNPGERVMMPTYGTPLRKLMFEPNDPQLEAAAQKAIRDAVEQWEPRIVIDNIVVTSQFPGSALSPDDPGQDVNYIIGVSITFFDPQDISQVDELVIELPVYGA